MLASLRRSTGLRLARHAARPLVRPAVGLRFKSSERDLMTGENIATPGLDVSARRP